MNVEIGWWFHRMPQILQDSLLLAEESLRGLQQIQAIIDSNDAAAAGKWLTEQQGYRAGLELDTILERVEDEFMAVSNQPVAFGERVEACAFSLVNALESDWHSTVFSAVVDAKFADRRLSLLDSLGVWGDVTAKDVVTHFGAITKAVAEIPRLTKRDADRIEALIKQEVVRAWHRRTAMGRTDAGDGASPRGSRLSAGEADILRVITEANRRLTTNEVVGAVTALRGACSYGTTKIYLSNLVKRGMLESGQAGDGKGYKVTATGHQALASLPGP